MMKNLDGRKLSHETLEEIRIRAVLRVQAGERPEEVIKTLGFSRSVIYDWLARYREGGLEGLKAKRLDGRPTKLDGAQIRQLYTIVATENPLQYRFEFALWTRAMIREVIRETFNVRLSEVSVGRLLHKLGLSPQKPLYRAYQRDPQKVDRWLTEEFPAIKREAKKAGAEIWFGDEASVRSDYHSGTTWAPKGETPVVDTTGSRFGLNLVSAINPRGEMRFMLVDGKLNGERFIEFLKRLTVGATQPVFLVVDGHPVHRSKAVRDHVASTNGRLKLFHLPPYSPHLNPDEQVWRQLKHHKIGRSAIKSQDDLKRLALRFMRSLQKMPALICAFFNDVHVRYITA
ncbi:MAG: IS630 family transposase [Betaproteobacteria bacterium]|nr:IS630 family transposase [Betaproteobacteria bacterium]